MENANFKEKIRNNPRSVIIDKQNPGGFPEYTK